MNPREAAHDSGVSESDASLLTLLSARAAGAGSRSLMTGLIVGIAGAVVTLIFGGHRYYLPLPFVAAACFALYGLAAHRAAKSTGDPDEDYTRGADARILMKACGIIGVASAIAALLAFFLLVLGPSWIS